MDKLSETQRTDIKKMSNVRLTSKLMAAGVSEEIEKLDRAGMMEAWVKLVGEGKEMVLVPTGSITMGYDSALEKERLAFDWLTTLPQCTAYPYTSYETKFHSSILDFFPNQIYQTFSKYVLHISNMQY